MNRARRADDILYPGSVQNDHVVSSVTQLAVSMRDFLEAARSVQPRIKQPSISSHIQDSSRRSSRRISRIWEYPRSLYGMLLASCTIGQRLDPKDRAGEWEKVNSAETIGREPEAQRLLVFDFMHRKGSLRFVDLLQVR